MPTHELSLEGYWHRRLVRLCERVAPEVSDADRIRQICELGPCEFSEQVLGMRPWSRQRDILSSILTHTKVAVRSGHKVAKSTSLAILALWFYCRYPRARVIITAPGYRQVEEIIWREVLWLVRNARIPIPGGGNISEKAATGLRHPLTQAQIIGYTSDKKEAIAGISGPAILYLVDEASGVPQGIFEAIMGNRAGGNAWLFLISNPTRADGEFYEAFHGKGEEAIGAKVGYHTIHIDSRESPNFTGECIDLGYPDGVPGLATPAWEEELRLTKGEDSAEYGIRVKGDFAYAEQLKICPMQLLRDAQGRWDEADDDGPLCIGIDAGGIGNDPLGLAARRSKRLLEVREHYKIGTNEAVVPLLLAIASEHGGLQGGTVVVDADGETGARQYAAVRAYWLEAGQGIWRLVRFRGSDAPRKPMDRQYGQQRDMLHCSFRDWLKAGGALPLSRELERQLHAPEFTYDLRMHLKVTPKDGTDGLRERLGRSPDLAEAAMLSTWVSQVREAVAAPVEPVNMDPREAVMAIEGGQNAFDPYAGM
jgi:phage terminase large subunit